jgi:hypothetical protein
MSILILSRRVAYGCRSYLGFLIGTESPGTGKSSVVSVEACRERRHACKNSAAKKK